MNKSYKFLRMLTDSLSAGQQPAGLPASHLGDGRLVLQAVPGPGSAGLPSDRSAVASILDSPALVSRLHSPAGPARPGEGSHLRSSSGRISRYIDDDLDQPHHQPPLLPGQKYAESTRGCPRVASLLLCNSFTDTAIFRYNDEATAMWLLPTLALKRMVMSGLQIGSMDEKIAEDTETLRCGLLS